MTGPTLEEPSNGERPRIVLPGGSGFLGRSFVDFATRHGYACTVLTRNPTRASDMRWDGKTLGDWQSIVDAAAAVVNFTGKSVNCIYNDANRREILESRLDSVRVVDEAVARCGTPPPVVVQAGSLAIYGDTSEPCDESAPLGEGFGADVCRAWEEAFLRERLPSTRKCMLRIGFVLGPGGGALDPLTWLVCWGLGGTVGSGKQWISWLHINDLNRIILECIEHDRYEGILNATGASPVTNREFMRELRRAMNRPWSPPAPAPLVKLGARFVMRTDASLALTGRKCYPKRLLDNGFEFEYTEIDRALRDVLR